VLGAGWVEDKETTLKRLLTLFLCVSGLLTGTPSLAAEAASAEAFFSQSLWDKEDKPQALSALRGKPLVVNFWARWCVPCREELPELQAAYEKHKGGGLVMVGIAIEDGTAALLEFITAYKLSYRMLVAKEKGLELMRDLGNDRAGLPFTVAISPEGHIVDTKLGVLRDGDLDRMLTTLKFKP
jgi:thiol-disulfide isomerase/thioredoxin